MATAAPAVTKVSTDFTRIVLPDGNGRTVLGQLGFQVGEKIHKGDVAEWPELNGYTVYNRSIGDGGRCERGKWRGGSCLFLFVN